MPRATSPLPVRERRLWRVAQGAVLALGLAVFLALIFAPRVGLFAFWNVLIPVAPALLVFAPGLWRNICPLGTTSLLPRHLDVSSRCRLSPAAHGWLTLGGLVLLLGLVPLRHVILDHSGPATAAVLAILALVAVGMGLVFEWKSGWCSSLCPVLPVEKLYGARPAFSPANAHCVRCQRCSTVCADSTPAMHPQRAPSGTVHRAAGALFIGGFAGYVWGWYQVPESSASGVSLAARAYAYPFVGFAFTLMVYLLLREGLARRHHAMLIRLFAAAAVSCYYWYRLPSLVGFGAATGALVDLRAVLPEWFPWASRTATTAIFAYWILVTSGPRRPWTVGPPYADEAPVLAACATAGAIPNDSRPARKLPQFRA